MESAPNFLWACNHVLNSPATVAEFFGNNCWNGTFSPRAFRWGIRFPAAFSSVFLKTKAIQKFPWLWPRISETIKARHRNAMDELERTWNAPGPVRRLAADKGQWCEKMVLQQVWDFSGYTRRQNFTELRTDGSWTLSCFSQCLTRIRYRNIVSRLIQGLLPKMPIWMLYYLDILPIRSHVVPTYVKPPAQTPNFCPDHLRPGFCVYPSCSTCFTVFLKANCLGLADSEIE